MFRLDATGQGGTVLRKVLGELAGWVEAVDPERANQEGGGERRARFLPSLTKPRRPSRAAAAAAAAAVAAGNTAARYFSWWGHVDSPTRGGNVTVYRCWLSSAAGWKKGYAPTGGAIVSGFRGVPRPR